MYLFHDAFVFKRGVIHNLLTDSTFFKLYNDENAADNLIDVYSNSSKVERTAITMCFKTRENWIPPQYSFDTTSKIADMLLGRPGSLVERLTISCRLLLTPSFKYRYYLGYDDRERKKK